MTRGFCTSRDGRPGRKRGVTAEHVNLLGGQAWSDSMTAPIDIAEFPPTGELRLVPSDLATAASLPYRSGAETAARRLYRVAGKRLLDITGSLLLLLLLLPVLLVVA